MTEPILQPAERRSVTEFFPIERRTDHQVEELPAEAESWIEMERRLA